MRVLIVSPLTGVTGGIQRWTNHIKQFNQCCPRQGISLSFFDFSRKSSGQLLADRPVKRLIMLFSEYTGLIHNAKKAIRDSGADLVHITSPGSFLLIKDLLLIHCAHRNEKKVVLHFRFGRIPLLAEKKNLEWRLLATAVRKAESVIVLDAASLQALRAQGFNHVQLVPNALADETLRLAETCPADRTPDEVLFVGHVIATKGIFELVEACRQLQRVTLKIVGTVAPEMKERLLQCAGENANKWLHVCGEYTYEDTIRAMCTASVFVLPSYTEGFPNVILESMACGCGIVATRVGAIPEMLGDDSSTPPCGICIEPRDKKALTAAIHTMLDPEIAAEYGKNASLRVKQTYSISLVYARLCDLWLTTSGESS